MTPRAVLPFLLVAVLATGCSSVEFWKGQFSPPTIPPQIAQNQAAADGENQAADGQDQAADGQDQAAAQGDGQADSQQNQPKANASRGANFGEKFEEDIELARTLTEGFWTKKFASEGKVYRPLQRFVAYTGNNGPNCGDQKALPDNAFYCPLGHFAAYDANWMRGLWKQLGDGAVYVIIPHEIGHAIQAQLGTRFKLNVERELQADCYAGGAIKGIIDAGQIDVEPGDDKELLNNLAAAGDPDDNWMKEDAHGTAAQRQQSFAKGFNKGVDAC